MLTVGADPELMLKNREGKLVSAIPLMRGTKSEPLVYKHGNTMHDNVNAEFAINPVKNRDEFIDFIARMLVNVKTEVQDYKLVAIPSANFPKSELNCEEARIFGCDADYSAWLLARNMIPMGASDSPFRTCGGHVHFGFPEIEQHVDGGYAIIKMTKFADLLLGIPSVLLDKFADSVRRRKLYGKSGCHRPKPYGTEYRSLSNFWIGKPALAELIYDLSVRASELFLEDKTPSYNDKGPVNPKLVKRAGPRNISQCIDTGNKRQAMEILNSVKKAVGKDLVDRVLSLAEKASLKDREIEVNWGIKG